MTYQIILSGRTIDFELVYRQRKTMEIRLLPPNQIRVVAPKGVPLPEIEKVMKSKENWILNKLDKLDQVNQADKKFASGEEFYYQGNFIPLLIQKGPKDHVVFNSEYIEIETINMDEAYVKELLVNGYYEETNKWINFYINKYVTHFKIKPHMIRIKNQRKRWGSCSSKKNLNFNWRLSMMPKKVIEYIVIHEMCHLIHMNHSKDFWTLVKYFIPSYKEERKWLKDHGHIIMNIIE